MTHNQAPQGTVLTDADILKLAFLCVVGDGPSYEFTEITLLEFARALLSAQPASAPLQDEDAKDAKPMQPLIVDQHGTIRFKANKIVDFLAQGRLNELACMEFSQEDQEQLAQLIGYSVGGYGELSYVSDESYDRAEAAAEKIRAAIAAQGGKQT